MSQTNFFDEGSSDDLDFLRSSNGPRKVPFYGTLEQSMYRYEKENQNQVNRLLEVRRQEAELARQKVEEGQRKKQKNKEQEQKDEKLQEYARLIQMREELKKAKELGQAEIGRAHRDADVSRKLKEDQEAYMKEERERQADATKQRSATAAATLKELDEEMNGPRRRLLETKKQVQKSESEKAHLLAAEYREKEMIQPEEKDDYISYQPFNKNISRGVYSRKVFGDYSKTNLHNSVVVSHKEEEGQISAFEAARIESEKTQTRRDQALNLKDEQRKKSLSRWQQVVEKDKEKKYQEDFDKHMERLKKAGNQQKIEEGKKYPEMQTKPATNLQNKARTQKEAEKAFEDMFLQKDKKISYPENKGKENRKSLQKTRPPSSGAAKTSKEKSAQKNIEGSMLSGFDNYTQRTEDLNQQQDMVFDESQEMGFDEATPKATGNTKAPQSSTKKTEEKKPENPFKKNTVQPSVSISEGVSPTYFNKGAKNASKEGEEEEESFGEYSESDSGERDEELEQSKSSQGNQKPYGVVSFGERKQPEYPQSHKNADPASLRPKHLQRALSSSYQVEQGNSIHESASKRDELGQSQSSGFSDSRMRSDRFGDVRSEEISPQKTFSESKRKQVPDDDIKNYISEQEHFLRKLDDDRKKLNDKLKASSQGGNTQSVQPASQMPQKSVVHERAERQKVSLPQISKEEEEAFQLLQKKATDLLNRCRQPEESKLDDSDEEPKYGFRKRTSPQKVSFAEGSKPAKPSYMMESQKNYRQNESPERRENIRTKRSESPASDLDYSMSEKDRSEKKSYTNSRNDYAVSFGERGVNATGTFGRSQKPFDESLGTRNYEDYKKPWKMEFDVGGSTEKERSPYKEQRKPWKMEFDVAGGEENRRSPPKEQRKPWKMEFEAVEEREVEREIKKNEEGGPSLAELFQRNKKKMVEKYENQKEKEKTEVKEKEVVSKPSRTKEEILKQRKAMMEYRGPVTQKKQNAQENGGESANQIAGRFGKERNSSKEPKPELLDRLALGKKAKVSKKDMHALTTKNYELLPEIKKKKEEERKKEEMKKRRENVKKLDQNLRSKTLK